MTRQCLVYFRHERKLALEQPALRTTGRSKEVLMGFMITMRFKPKVTGEPISRESYGFSRTRFSIRLLFK